MLGWILAGIVAVLLIGWFFFRRGASDFRSLIVLLKEPRLVTPEHVKTAAEKAGLEFTSIEGEHPIQIKHPKAEFYLGSHPNSYGAGRFSKEKMADMSAGSLDAACRIIEGTARQMGVTVEG